MRDLASAAQVKIGSAVSGERLDPVTGEAAYRQWVGDQLNTITTENELKWKHVEPAQGVFTYDKANKVLDFAEAHQQDVRGHTLVWHSDLPDWVGELQPTELRSALQTHITSVVGNYRDRVDVWDVVNEPLDDQGNLRGSEDHSFWAERLGASYIADAFRWAHDADPDAELYLNEYGIEADSPKARGLYALVQQLVEDDVPIDGIGFQTHKLETTRLSGLSDMMRRFTDLGLEVAITEVDVRMPKPADPGKLARQADVYGWATGACLAVPGCVSVTTWGFTDKYSWINTHPDYKEDWEAATLLDDQYTPKPAYGRVQQVLAAGRPAVADPVAAWRLDEPSGVLRAADASTSPIRHFALAGDGVLGQEGRTPYLGGFKAGGVGAGATTLASAVRTDISYTVTAWINPSSSTADQVIASQAGTNRNAFVLGQRAGKYYFTIPTQDSASGVDQTLESKAAVVPGEWIHVTALWNNGWGHAQIYLNGVWDSSSPLWNKPTWASTGVFRIGGLAASKAFGGSISDLRVYQRAVPDTEIAGLATPVVGEWTFDGHTGDTSWFHRDAWARSDAPLTWTANRHGTADSAINLTGTQLIDTRGGQPLFTDRSYAISVWVKLTDANGDGRADGTGDQVVLAADGTTVSPFYLRFKRGSTAADDRWQFAMPVSDTGGAAQTVTSSSSTARGGVWTHLAVVWNKTSGRAQLFVDNTLAGTGPVTSSWRARADGSLHIGVAQAGNLIGALDDLRLYQRTLTSAEIAALYAG
ncbi:hypothetical protein Cci01nite_12720 [Catellatospora citrea]|uniref:Beta-xylanase n=1 Tax=Catellatospora citrea TaxID=53366 RepID=A0A8J3NXR3_9ACTN|nr:hypothetical protein Cci01nite_12720 [Catellatospora citrea]